MGDGLGHGCWAEEGNVGIDLEPIGSGMAVITLDPSWLADCLALDRCALQGLWTEEQWHRELDDPRRLCLGWTDAKTLLGVACGWLVADELHVTAIAIHPAVRRRGHGKQLLAALLQRARQQGAVHATLEVASDNHGALALYGTCGFQSAGTRLKYYSDGRDALIQWCRISPVD
ncbi:GNAT family N-acetyltransferase [Synechococcus sp. AH-551-E05]|nr:GNAT family N-acetyltransferase [Synechococcus sp. AH-551-E05]MDB4651050.1 GNAT family N-acetyltransferase [Synechococcus sp. AH-551-E05]